MENIKRELLHKTSEIHISAAQYLTITKSRKLFMEQCTWKSIVTCRPIARERLGKQTRNVRTQ
jgi:hypothetical protein